MKLLIALVALAALCSCGTLSRSTVTTYGADGKVTQVTETRESVAKSIVTDLATKSVIVTTDGWGASINVGAEVTDGLSPSLDVKAGKFSAFYGSFLPGVTGEQIAEIIEATGGTLAIGASGITDTDTGGTKAAASTDTATSSTSSK